MSILQPPNYILYNSKTITLLEQASETIQNLNQQLTKAKALLLESGPLDDTDFTNWNKKRMSVLGINQGITND